VGIGVALEAWLRVPATNCLAQSRRGRLGSPLTGDG